jgi:HTH-type transcriptional regulator/antitoxin HipB
MDYPLQLADQLRAHLRALRKQRGLTQAALGQRLGLGQVRIAEIEANPGLVSVDQLVKLLSMLGVTLVLRDSNNSEVPSISSAGVEPATSKPVRAEAARRRAAPAEPAPPSPQKTKDKSSGLRIPPKKGSW